MTTIAYTAGVMAADTRAYAGFNSPLGSKAHGAMRAGASAERAVEIAAEIDVWTGRPVITLRHEG